MQVQQYQQHQQHQQVRARQEQHQQRLEEQQKQGASIGALTQRLELLQAARKQVSAGQCLHGMCCVAHPKCAMFAKALSSVGYSDYLRSLSSPEPQPRLSPSSQADQATAVC
jgi:peptide subunit release factor RF-3